MQPQQVTQITQHCVLTPRSLVQQQLIYALPYWYSDSTDTNHMAPLTSIHSACLCFKHVQYLLHKHTAEAVGLLWFSTLPNIRQDYLRNIILVSIWGSLWNMTTPFIKQKHIQQKGSPFLSGKRNALNHYPLGKIETLSPWLWEQMLGHQVL